MKILVSPKGNFTGGLQKLPLIPRSQFHTPPAKSRSQPIRLEGGIPESRLWKPPQPQHCAGCKCPPSPGMRLIPSGIMMDRGFELLERGVHLHWHCYVAKQKLLSPRPHCWPQVPQPCSCCGPKGAPSRSGENSRLPPRTKSCARAFPTCSSS